ncbi:MAG: AAA family ATPase [Alphaproteobacteria bacterium GM202ARS2]|nr:AAA family ATPase [Alphaproteobacteria bacterium GM202ARS2]
MKAIERIKISNVAAFEEFDCALSPGINAFIGVNGTGKTRLLKLLYIFCHWVERKYFDTGNLNIEYLNEYFLPSENSIGRLVRKGQQDAEVRFFIDGKSKFMSFSRNMTQGLIFGGNIKIEATIKGVYIPSKDILANAPGFRSLYEKREIHFEKVFKDILDHAYLPSLKNIDSRKAMLDILQREMGGQVVIKGEEFFLVTDKGEEFEFTLLAEGMRKLGLLWLLIKNGSLIADDDNTLSVLCWDEPETNLNPRMFESVVDVLLALQRQGVQIFLATHSYPFLKFIDLKRNKESDKVLFHALDVDTSHGVTCESTKHYEDLAPNALVEAYDTLYDYEIKRMVGRKRT